MFDDDTFNNFSKYLLDLGFLNKSAYDEFSKKYKEISQRKLYSSNIDLTNSIKLSINKTFITDTLVEFYNSLQEERKKLIAINIFDKYIKKNENNIKFKIFENKHVESFNIPGIENHSICIHCKKPKIEENDKKIEFYGNCDKNNKLNEDLKQQQNKGNIFQSNTVKGKVRLVKKSCDQKQIKEKYPSGSISKYSPNKKNNSASKYIAHGKLFIDNARKNGGQNQDFNKFIKEIKNMASRPILIQNNNDYIKKMKNGKYEDLIKNFKVLNKNNINIKQNKKVKVSYELDLIGGFKGLFKDNKKSKEKKNPSRKIKSIENKYNKQNKDHNGKTFNNIKKNEIDVKKKDNYDNIKNNYMNGDNNNDETIDNNKCNGDDEGKYIENNNGKNSGNNKNCKEISNNNNCIEDNINNNYNEDNNNEQEGDEDNENSINQYNGYADKASVEEEEEDDENEYEILND